MKTVIRLITLAFVMAWANFALAVDINTADAQTIAKELPGIGAVKAAAIVEYRKKHGRFGSVDELAQVKGIGDKTVSKVRSFVQLKGAAFGTKTKKPAANAKSRVKTATTKNTKAQKSTSKTKSSSKTKVAVKKKAKSSAVKAKTKSKVKSKNKSKKTAKSKKKTK